jgi:hypothetical protein
MVSNVSDFYRNDNFIPYIPVKPIPWPQGVPVELPWNEESLKLLRDVMQKMKELDEKLGLKDCEDPNKAEWMKEIENRVRKLEKNAKKIK